MDYSARFLLAQLYWKKENPMETTTLIIIVVVIAVVAIGYSIIKRLMAGDSAMPTVKRAEGFSRSAFRRKAEEFGFSGGEAEFLEFYARKLGTTTPQTIFGNRVQLDSFMRNAFRYIEQHSDTEEIAEEHKRQLFSMREALGARTSAGSTIASTRQLKAKTPLSIVTAKEAHYSSILLMNEPRVLYIEPALDAFGQAIRFGYGSKLTVYFYSGNHVGYSFQSKARGMVDMDGKKLMCIAHSDRIKPLPARRNQRSEVHFSGRYYLVHVKAAKDKGKVVKSVQVERAAVPGIINDLSGGGLSMQTISPANPGEFVKVEFDLGSGTRSAYASVIRVSRTRTGALMHMKFVRIMPKTVNEIRAVVYGYD